jgi:eukaryotic-like serine/threonine-protein kinase
MIGTRIGNWILEAELGTGSLGTVYRAVNSEPKNENDPAVAAVKILSHPLCVDPTFQARFPAEMLALRRLTHPNIARFHDSGVHAGLPYYATEFVDGTDLATLLATTGAGLSWPEHFFRIAVQAVRALKHAHHRSILHRELKPGNLILLADGSLKVTDFGVAKILNRAPLTLPADAMGTTGFLAPEHFTGKPLTRRSDLYALGGVLYTVLTGRAPFAAASAAELMHKHCYTLPDRPANFVPKLPHELDEFVCALLAKDPARRPASAAALLDELDQIRGKMERKGTRVLLPPSAEDPTGQHTPLGTVPTEAPDPAERPGTRRQAIVLGALFVAVVGAILFVFFRPRPAPEVLWDAVQPRLASNEPDDWDAARDALDALARWHPDWRPDDVRDAKQFVLERKELAKTFLLFDKAKYATEAERLYHRGLKLVQVADVGEARRTWESLIRIFADSSVDRHWVDLARRGLEELGNHAPARRNSNVPTDAIARARKLRESGHKADADAMLNAVEELYRDRPDVIEAVRAAR